MKISVIFAGYLISVASSSHYSWKQKVSKPLEASENPYGQKNCHVLPLFICNHAKICKLNQTKDKCVPYGEDDSSDLVKVFSSMEENKKRNANDLLLLKTEIQALLDEANKLQEENAQLRKNLKNKQNEKLYSKEEDKTNVDDEGYYVDSEGEVFYDALDSPHFTTSGLFELQNGFNLSDSYIAAYADFNGDAYLDIITYNKKDRKMIVNIWDHDKFSFYPGPELTIDKEPVNVGVADFDYDGVADLYVQFTDEICLYFGGDLKRVERIKGRISGQPLLLDYDGDLKPDFFGTFNDSVAVVSMENQIIFDQDKYCKLSNDLPTSFVDLDGDCVADLFIPCENGDYEVWLNNKDGSFVKHSNGHLPQNVKFINFADFDSDGTMDLLLVSCKSDDCTIRIVYNHQMPLCSSRDAIERCRSFSNLCTSDASFRLAFDRPTVFSLSETVGAKGSLVMLKNQFHQNSIKIGDLNMDSYPDLVFVAEQTGNKRIFYFENYACDDIRRKLLPEEKCEKRAFHSVSSASTSILSKFSTVEQVALFDLDERGAFDILIVHETKQHLSVAPIFNNFFNDAYFLKVFSTNGVCFRSCKKAALIKPLGSNYPGPTFKFSVLDPLGHKRFGVGSQLFSSTHGALQIPFNLYGLGRTNNYIEEFYVGVPVKSDDRIIERKGIIPNSQILIHPPSGDRQSLEWIFELFISPGDYAIFVLLTLIVGMAILGGIVAFLRWREKREDEEERRKALHIINFDAL